MAAITNISADPESPLRLPLRPRTVTPSPTLHQLRRKDAFQCKPDSSEDFPSSHESIFEALYLSANNSEDSGRKFPLVEATSRIPRPVKNDENRREPSPSVIDTVEFRYGTGTALDPIKEQKSYATLRTGTTRSASNSPIFPILRHKDSLLFAKSPRRKSSFSLNDIALVKKSYHDACSDIEKEASDVHEIYAEPKIPTHAPPDRRPTPDGMPSWTEAQRAPRQVSQPQQNTIQRWLNIPTSATLASTSNGVRTVSAPVGGRTAPKFRPPKSVYGPLNQHPFVKASVAQVVKQPATGTLSVPKGRRLRKEQRVRFTPSATARDSEMLNLQAAIESSTASAIHPLSSPPVRVVQKEPSCPHGKHRPTSATPEAVVGTQAENLRPASSPVSRVEIPKRRSSLRLIPRPSFDDLVRRSRDRSSMASIAQLISGTRRTDSPTASTTHLMSGALAEEPLPIPEQASSIPLPVTEWCWKCSVQSAFETVDHVWLRSAGFVCMVCCGFDIDEDGNARKSTYNRNVAMSSGYLDPLPPRVVILQQTPGVML